MRSSSVDAQAVLRCVQSQRAAMVEVLERLVACESPTDDKQAVGKILDILAGELAKSAMSVRRLPGIISGGMLFARPRNRSCRSPFQMMVGHCDTVWPLGTLAQMPLINDGTTLRGPGSFDMKGGLTHILFALRTLALMDLRPPLRPVVVMNSDEEIGSPDSKPLITSLARKAARAFVLEPAFTRQGKLKTSRKAVGNFTITVRGTSAHASLYPDEGVSAILEFTHQVQRLFALNDPARGITVNVGTIAGGTRSNVVAGEVRADVDVRVPSMADAAAFESALRASQPVHPNSIVEIEGGFHHPPMEASPRNQALWHLARKLGRQIGLELEEASVGGASDGNTISQYTATLDGLGAVGDGAHAAHEHVDLDRMIERCALLVLLLMDSTTHEITPGACHDQCP